MWAYFRISEDAKSKDEEPFYRVAERYKQRLVDQFKLYNEPYLQESTELVVNWCKAYMPDGHEMPRKFPTYADCILILTAADPFDCVQISHILKSFKEMSPPTGANFIVSLAESAPDSHDGYKIIKSPDPYDLIDMMIKDYTARHR